MQNVIPEDICYIWNTEIKCWREWQFFCLNFNQPNFLHTIWNFTTLFTFPFPVASVVSCKCNRLSSQAHTGQNVEFNQENPTVMYVSKLLKKQLQIVNNVLPSVHQSSQVLSFFYKLMCVGESQQWKLFGLLVCKFLSFSTIGKWDKNAIFCSFPFRLYFFPQQNISPSLEIWKLGIYEQ